MSGESKQPNWVEKGKLWILIAVVAGNGLAWYGSSRQLSAIEIREATEEVVDIFGEVSSANKFIFHDGKNHPLIPVGITVHNAGRSPCQIDVIQFRVYEGRLSDLLVQSPEAKSDFLGVIDMESSKWRELPELRGETNGFQLLRDQARNRTFHVAHRCSQNDIILKFEASVHVSGGDQILWRGLSNPELCYPVSPAVPSGGNIP